MSEIKVNSIKGVGASAAAITVNNSDGTCTANLTNKPNRNLIINGAMQVAQRGTSSTTSGYGSVDRFKILFDNTDEAPTHAQVDLTSSDTGPYEEGFRKALKITNGNQTSGAGANDFIKAQQDIEGQNIVNSGWDATDPNSKLTISYWVKSSVPQTFFGRFRAFASTQYEYTYSFALSTNTWTKVTETVPGNSNFSSIPNTNAHGFFHIWQCFFGTDFTNNKTLDTWAVKDNANKSPDMTSTWYTTNNATFEITGVQLEVSDHASDFQFKSFAEEFALCQRYYQQFDDSSNPSSYVWGMGYGGGGNSGNLIIYYQTVMRTIPTASGENLNNLNFNDGTAAYTAANNTFGFAGSEYSMKVGSGSLGSMTGKALSIYSVSSTNTKIKLDAEL